MMASHSAPASAGAMSGLSISVERLRLLLLWLTGASSTIVFIVPSPYELISLLTIIVFALSGLTLSRTLMPLALLLMLINIGYSVSASAVIGITTGSGNASERNTRAAGSPSDVGPASRASTTSNPSLCGRVALAKGTT